MKDKCAHLEWHVTREEHHPLHIVALRQPVQHVLALIGRRPQPQRVEAVNQDALVKLIGWAGNLTSSGCQFNGVLIA